MIDWPIWVNEFLAEYRRLAGYEILPDEMFEERLRAFYAEGVTPAQAAAKEMSEEL